MAALRTTPQLRLDWAPPCIGPWAKVTLYGGATVTVDPLIVEALQAADTVYRLHDYKSRPRDTGAQNCRRITGGRGFSLHAYGIAVDRNWSTNPYGMKLVSDRPAALNRDLKAIRTKNGKQVWGWGGDYSGNKDAMHDEIRCTPADLATGIDWSTVAGHTQAPAVPNQEDGMAEFTKEQQDQIALLAEKGAMKAIQSYFAQPDNRLFKFLRQLMGKE